MSTQCVKGGGRFDLMFFFSRSTPLKVISVKYGYMDEEVDGVALRDRLNANTPVYNGHFGHFLSVAAVHRLDCALFTYDT